jgi:predicted DNA-binding transcriptional regulator
MESNSMVQIPKFILSLKVSPYTVVVFAYLVALDGKFVSIRQMSRDLSISRKRLALSLNELLERRIVERERIGTGIGYKYAWRINPVSEWQSEDAAQGNSGDEKSVVNGEDQNKNGSIGDAWT